MLTEHEPPTTFLFLITLYIIIYSVFIIWLFVFCVSMFAPQILAILISLSAPATTIKATDSETLEV